jgi:hypothetical protein
MHCEDCHQPASENDFSYVDRKVRHQKCREASRDLAPPTCGPTPPLCCDLCDWPMNASEIVRLPDGAIPGLLVCALCTEDNLATTDAPRCEVGMA